MNKIIFGIANKMEGNRICFASRVRSQDSLLAMLPENEQSQFCEGAGGTATRDRRALFYDPARILYIKSCI